MTLHVQVLLKEVGMHGWMSCTETEHTHKVKTMILKCSYSPDTIFKFDDGYSYCHIHTGIAKVLVLYGWMTLGVLHPTSCCPRAHTVDLGMKTVGIQRMWLSPVLLLRYQRVAK